VARSSLLEPRVHVLSIPTRAPERGHLMPAMPPLWISGRLIGPLPEWAVFWLNVFIWGMLLAVIIWAIRERRRP
jgi:hypothetical protein